MTSTDRKNLIGIFVTFILIFGFTMQTLAAGQEKPEANANVSRLRAPWPSLGGAL